MLTEEQRSIVSSWVRAGNKIMAIQQLRLNSSLSLRDAKAVVIHITRTTGTCNRCGYPLGGEGTAHCPYCRALNYDW